MAKALISDELCSLIAAHLPVRPPSPRGGRPRISDRATLIGILFVLRTGIPWEHLPRELGCGSGMTCWRRLHEWMQTGVWQSIHEAILRRLREYDQIERDRACIDAASVPSPRGGEHTGPNPTDRGKLGCKHHILVDQRGLPLVAKISGAQVHDSRLLIPIVEAIPAIKGLSGELANVQENCMLTVRMHLERTVPGYADEALLHASRDTASSHANGLAAGVGSSSEPLGGFTDFAGCGFAMSAAQIFIRPFSCWPARSSAGGTLNGIVRDTYSFNHPTRLSIAEVSL